MALLNLAINGPDGMPDGGSLTIAVRDRWLDEHPTLPPGQYVEIAVIDIGEGMPEDVANRAFDLFFTTKGIGKGTGLGLSQVYGMARQAGGEAVIESERGKGPAVKLLLPRAESVNLGIEQPAGSARPDWSGPRSRILVVDDDAQVRESLVASLQILGYRVVAAQNGIWPLNPLSQRARTLWSSISQCRG